MSLERFCRVLRARASHLQQVQEEEHAQLVESRRLTLIAQRFLEDVGKHLAKLTKLWAAQNPESVPLVFTSTARVLLMPDTKSGTLISVQVTNTNPNPTEFRALYNVLAKRTDSNEPVRQLRGVEGLVKLGQFVEFTKQTDWYALERLRAHEENQARAKIHELQKELDQLKAQVGPASFVTHLAASNLHLVPDGLAEEWFRDRILRALFLSGLATGFRGYGSPLSPYVEGSQLFIDRLREAIHQEAPEFWPLVAKHARTHDTADQLGTLLGRHLKAGQLPKQGRPANANDTAFHALRQRTIQLGVWLNKNHPELVESAGKLWP